MYALNARTADEAWRAAAALFIGEGEPRHQQSRGGATLELLHVGITIEDPRERWVTSRTPAMNPAFALVEVFWIAGGRQDAALPVFWNPLLPRYCGHADVYRGAYGHRLRAHFGMDQLDRVYRAIDARPDTRQAVLQIWDGSEDLPRSGGAPARDDIPCNIVAFPKLRAGRLEWMQVMRSNDLFLGLPHNVVQFTALQEMLAGWLNVEPGAYCHVTDSLHVYDRDLDAVRASTPPAQREPTDRRPRIVPRAPGSIVEGGRSSDGRDRISFAIDRRSWNAVVPDILRRLDAMTAPSLTRDELRTVALAGDAPAAYEDSVRIAAADVARRLGWPDAAEELASTCSDTVLRTLWDRWAARTAARTSRAKVPVGSSEKR